MSRFSLEDDAREYDDVRPNATCLDCGTDFSHADDDPGLSLCDACSDQRDAHTTALERRMVKADLPSTSDQRIA